ncbi:MAG: AAA family ATPase [Bacteroidia bacterium]|nr:AAA family ATPase [Bacteroidia bacterium]MDW8088519.1 AAA family ATPase [Bacteroidia bacterium]
MGLRALELRGFKSFADPTRLPLTQALIGIVGPNGCGKSNLADAIRWILGQQRSRSLRIEKAEHLIFSGSEKRKPLPFAEVSLEVEGLSPEAPRLTFTRRVHRSGETEYLLNGSPVRLKDFLTYFWQLNLSAQAVLDSAQLEALIQDTGEARRALLESLAGIEKYHYYRREALAELEKTAQALQQIGVVIQEVESQLQVLRAQAEKVHTYRNLQAEYRTTLSEWIAYSLQGLKAQEEALLAELRQQKALLAELAVRLQEIEADLGRAEAEDLHSALEACQVEYRTHQTALQNLLQTKAAIQERLRLLQQQQEEVLSEKAHRLRQKTELTHELSAHAQKQADYEKEWLAQQQRTSDLKQALQKAESALRQAESELNSQQKRCASLEPKVRQLESRRQALELSRQSLQGRWAKLKAERAALEERLRALELERAETQAELTALEAKRKQLQAALASHQKTAAYLASRQKIARQKLDWSEKLKAHLEGELLFLQRLSSEAAGVPSFLHRLRAEGQLEFWRTEEIFWGTPEVLRLVAVLVCLEPPTLWVRTPEAAETLHALILQRAEGSFSVRWYQPKPPWTTHTSWRAHLQTLPGFEGLAEYLWGEVEIASEPFPHPTARRFVHPEGKLVFLADGRSYHFAQLQISQVGLPHRLQLLEGRQARLTRYQRLWQAYADELAERLQRLPLNETQNHLRLLEQRVQALEKQLSTTSARQEEMQHSLQLLQKQFAQLDQESQSLQTELEAVHEALEAEKAHFETARQALATLQECVQENTRQLQTLQRAFQEARLALAQLEQEKSSLIRTQRLLSQQLEEVSRRLIFLERRAGELAEAIPGLAAQEANLATQQKELEGRLQSLEAILAEQRAKVEAHQAQLLALHEARAKYQAQRSALQEAINSLEKRIGEIQQSRALLLQRLEVELGLSPAELPPPPQAPLSEEAVERRLGRLRRAMQALGELNFEAAALLEELTQRHAHLSQEEAQIRQAYTRLTTLLQNLEREAQSQFQSVFTKVGERFQALFQILFGEESSATLQLTQPESPLTSPIEILARPPGKKVRTLQQLSGGEKTLTALALVLATFSVRPSALCVLDEVDAPLDDANAHHLARLLRSLAGETTFLIITHNKITMSYCDVLYGVTMAEKGVSLILAAEFASMPSTLLAS